MACLKPAVELVVQQFLWPLRLGRPDGRLRSLSYITPSSWNSSHQVKQSPGRQDRLPGSLNPHKEPFQPRIHVNTSIRVNQFTSDPKKKNLPRFLVRNLTSFFLQFIKILYFSFQLHKNLRNQFYKLQNYNRTEEKPGNSLENKITIEKSVIQVGLEIRKLSKDCNQYFKPTLLGECNWNDESYKSQVTSMLESEKETPATRHKETPPPAT